MILKSLFTVLGISLLMACQQKLNSGNSDCLKNKIEEFSKESCNKATIKEYEFQTKKVYVLDQSACGNDMAAEVIDQNCSRLGYLGGFAGNVKINGEDFSNAKFIKTVWEKK